MGQYYKGCYKKQNEKEWKGLTSYDFNNGAKLMEHSYIGNSFVNAVMSKIYNNPMQVVWAGDYADGEDGGEYNIYELYKVDDEKIDNYNESDFKFIVNHNKKQFVALSKSKKDRYGFRINPLPLLTADGNGRGGGDYSGTSMKLVGTWARDLISVESMKPKDYKELVPNFKECAYDEE